MSEPVGPVALEYESLCRQNNCRVDRVIRSQLTLPPQRIDELDLSRTFVGPKGFKAFVKVIPMCPVVEVINVSNNGLTNECILELCSVLRDNRTVTALNVSGNPIDFHSGKALIDLVEFNNHIARVEADDTDMYDVVVDRLLMSVRENKKMKESGSWVVPKISTDYSQKIPTLPPVVVDRTEGTITPKAPTPASNRTPRSTGTVSLPIPVSQQYKPTALELLRSSPRVTTPSGRKPIPGIASMILSKMGPSQKEKLRQQYAERTAKASLDAASYAKKSRERLLALESEEEAVREQHQARTVILPETVTTIEEEKTQEDNEDSINEGGEEDKPCDRLQPTSSPISARKKSPKNVPIEPPAPPPNMMGTLERDALLAEVQRLSEEQKAKEGSASPLDGSLVAETKKSSHLSDTSRERRSSSIIWGVNSHGPPEESVRCDSFISNTAAYLQPLKLIQTDGDNKVAKQFKKFINDGAAAFELHDLKAALDKWSQAISLANAVRNKEWVLFVTQNLQILSFESLMEQGEKAITESYIPNALKFYGKALTVAKRAKQRDWEDRVLEMISVARNKAFDRRLEVATEILHSYESFALGQEVTGETQFVDDCDEEGGAPVKHSLEFVHEWDSMVLVYELTECWGDFEAVALYSQEQLEHIEEILKAVADIRCNRMFVPENSHKHCVSFLRTSYLNPTERKRLIELHKQILVNSQRVASILLECLTRLYLGNLYLSANNLSDALNMFDTALELVKHPKLSASPQVVDMLSCMSGLGKCILLMLLGDHPQSKLELSFLLNKLNQILRPSSYSHHENNKNKPTREVLLWMRDRVYNLLVEISVFSGRYQEAFEMEEERKTEWYDDMLSSKTRLNFPAQTTTVNVHQYAKKLNVTFISYAVHNTPLWNSELGLFEFKEHVYIWAMGKSGVLKFVLVDCWRILPDNTTLSSVIDNSIRRTESHTMRYALQLLWNVLIAPVVHYLELTPSTGVFGPRVVAVPDKMLWFIPFTALLDDANAYFAEKYVVTTSPSILSTMYAFISAAKIVDRGPTRRVVWGPSEGPQRMLFLRSDLVAETQVLAKAAKAEIIQDSAVDELALKVILQTCRVVHVSACAVGNSKGMLTKNVGGGILVNKQWEPSGTISFDVISNMDVPACVVSLGRCEECTPSTVHVNVNSHERNWIHRKTLMEENVRAWISAGTACVMMSRWGTSDSVDFWDTLYKSFTFTSESTSAFTAALRKFIELHRLNPERWAGLMACGVDG
eukprot:PhF_6_TR31855/c0_g1_i1/m.47244